MIILRRLPILVYLIDYLGTEFVSTTTVTGSFGTLFRSVGIFEERLNRFDAAQRCSEYGYEHLEDSKLTYIIYTAIKQKLREDLQETFDPNDTRFWTDFYRSSSTTTEWHQTSLCWEATYKVTLEGEVAWDSRCIAVHFQDNFETVIHEAVNCHHTMPFICITTELSVPYLEYANSAVITLPATCEEIETNAVTYEDCLEECGNTYSCIAINYDTIYHKCKIIDIDFNHGYATYELEYHSKIKHAVKNGTEVTFHTAPQVGSVTDVEDAFPCGFGAATMVPPTSTVSRVSDASSVSTATGQTSSTLTVQNVTAYIRWIFSSIIDIYDEDVTWYDAVNICFDKGQKLETDRLEDIKRHTMIRQALLDANHPGDITFWTMWFKPVANIDKWYKASQNGNGDTLCYEGSVNFTESVSSDERCSVWHFTGADRDDEIVVSADQCSKKHAFYCYSISKTKLTFTEYEGWSYSSTPQNTNIVFDSDSRTIPDCRDKCSRISICISWTYWHDTGECFMVYAKNEFAIFTYEIERKTENVTHGHKQEYEVNLHPESGSISATNYSQNFPACNFSTSTSSSTSRTTAVGLSTNSQAPTQSTTTRSSAGTRSNGTSASTTVLSTATGLTTRSSATKIVVKTPASNSTTSISTRTSPRTTSVKTTTSGTCIRHCTCSKKDVNNSTELEEVIKDLVQNLTIDKDSTSKVRRKLISADDSRPSARCVGILGIVLLSLTFGGIIMSDVPLLFSVLQAHFSRIHHCIVRTT